MGRTYKKNDPYRSRRPKSIREKRQWSGSQKPSDSFDAFTDDSRGRRDNTRNKVRDYFSEEDYQ